MCTYNEQISKEKLKEKILKSHLHISAKNELINELTKTNPEQSKINEIHSKFQYKETVYNKNKRLNFSLIAVGAPIAIFLFITAIYWQANDDLDNIRDLRDSFGIDESDLESDLVFKVWTDNSKYTTGQGITIFGSLHDSEGAPVKGKVKLLVKQNDNLIYDSSVFSKNGTFRVSDLSIEQTGTYVLAAQATAEGQKEFTQTLFLVKDFLETKLGTGILATIFFTMSLLVLIGIQTKLKLRITSIEPLRFALLTLCSLVPVVSLIAADVSLGTDSPLGLVLYESSDNDFEWIIHVGGSIHDNYKSGIKIPVYVFIFGMLGGYIRFLHKTAAGWFVTRAEKEWKRLNPEEEEKLEQEMLSLATKADNEGFLKIPPPDNTFNVKETQDAERKAEEDKAIIKRIIFNNSMEDLALIFLSPILAFVTFFLLFQGGIDPIKNMPTMAIASFATGLITNEIIARLENFASSTIGGMPTKKPKKTAPTSETVPKMLSNRIDDFCTEIENSDLPESSKESLKTEVQKLKLIDPDAVKKLMDTYQKFLQLNFELEQKKKSDNS